MNTIRTTILGSALTGGSVLGLAGVVSAQTDDSTPADDTTEQPTDDTTEQPTDDTTVDTTAGERRTERHERCDARHAEREENRQAMADLLGLEVEKLTEPVRGGATLADIAQAQGVPTSDVVDLIVENTTDRIDAAVEAGRITAEEAAEKTADLDERVQTRVEQGRPERGDGGRASDEQAGPLAG